MKNFWRTTTIIIACMYAYDTYVALHNRKLFYKTKENWRRLEELNDYLISVIGREEVEVTPFDRIAIRTILEE